MQDPANVRDDFTVSRILSVSPEQDELIRRNHSRIFIVPARDNIINSILYSRARSNDDYTRAIGRAITEAGLKTSVGDLQLRTVFDSKFGSGVFMQHFAANGWLVDDKREAFDLFIELEAFTHQTDLPEMETYDPVIIEGHEEENPLCIKLDVENLFPSFDNNEDEDRGDDEQMSDDTHVAQPAHEPEVAAMQNGNGRGRVTSPDDRRLKENRPPQMVTARATQNGDDDQGASSQGLTGRQAGRPGRVRFRSLDGRLKANRRPLEEQGAGGR